MGDILLHRRYEENHDILCRTKLAVRNDAEVLFENIDLEKFGTNRVVFYSDYMQQFEDLAKFIGFQVAEKDKSQTA